MGNWVGSVDHAWVPMIRPDHVNASEWPGKSGMVDGGEDRWDGQ